MHIVEHKLLSVFGRNTVYAVASVEVHQFHDSILYRKRASHSRSNFILRKCHYSCLIRAMRLVKRIEEEGAVVVLGKCIIIAGKLGDYQFSLVHMI